MAEAPRSPGNIARLGDWFEAYAEAFDATEASLLAERVRALEHEVAALRTGIAGAGDTGP